MSDNNKFGEESDAAGSRGGVYDNPTDVPGLLNDTTGEDRTVRQAGKVPEVPSSSVVVGFTRGFGL